MELSKSGKKRFKQKVKDLKRVLLQSEKAFLNVWRKQVNGWISEIHFRAQAWAEGGKVCTSTDIFSDCDEAKQSVFAVCELAATLLKAIGERAEKLVGYETCYVLEGECVKSIAKALKEPLDESLVQHWLYRNTKI
jgi:hypothetical protein